MVEPAPAAEGACPFPGLEYFTEPQAEWLYGRDSEVAEAVLRLDDSPGGHGRWLIDGAIGAGKSSFVRAGLIPAVRKRWICGGPPHWRVGVLCPGLDPVLRLAHCP